MVSVKTVGGSTSIHPLPDVRLALAVRSCESGCESSAEFRRHCRAKLQTNAG
jgi:hypothetical protein